MRTLRLHMLSFAYVPLLQQQRFSGKSKIFLLGDDIVTQWTTSDAFTFDFFPLRLPSIPTCPGQPLSYLHAIPPPCFFVSTVCPEHVYASLPHLRLALLPGSQHQQQMSGTNPGPMPTLARRNGTALRFNFPSNKAGNMEPNPNRVASTLILLLMIYQFVIVSLPNSR